MGRHQPSGLVFRFARRLALFLQIFLNSFTVALSLGRIPVILLFFDFRFGGGFICLIAHAL